MNDGISKRHLDEIEVSLKLKNTDVLQNLKLRLTDPQLSDDLPIDKKCGGGPRTVLGAGLSLVDLEPPPAARLLSFSEDVAQWFNLDQDSIFSLLPQLSGAAGIGHVDPYATCYGGHQFGSWAGQLGDGRATGLGILKGEPYNEEGYKELHAISTPLSPRWEWQLKGAGITPYSRRGDGKAVLRSSVREYLCSEAMAALGVPTTRALSLVDTGEKIWRDMLYDGNPRRERGAIVCRVAPSFVRFGHIELPSSRGDYFLTKQWVEHIIRQHYLPKWTDTDSSEITEEHIFRWFNELCERTLKLVCEWMRVGFVHGVMNTDNMSVLGLTIDYGPYGWIEDFDLHWTPNISDAAHRRYRFGYQADIARWNLSRLAYALAPILKEIDPFIEVLETWPEHFREEFTQMMCRKLGMLSATEPGLKVTKDERILINEGMNIWQEAELDMTLFFRTLNHLNASEELTEWKTLLKQTLYQDEGRLSSIQRAQGRETLWTWIQSFRSYLSRVSPQQSLDRRLRVMNSSNPLYVLRNYLAQEAIEALENGDENPLERLRTVLKQPYTHQTAAEDFAQLRPQWARTRPGCSMLSCSS